MKKIFTLFAMLFVAVGMYAQEPLWTADGAYSYYPEDWGYDNTNVMLVGNKGVKAESYDGYTIIRSWCGVEGFDLAFGHEKNEGEYMTPTSICTVKGDNWSDEKIVKVETYDYYVVETGLEDYPYARIAKDYSYLTIVLAKEATDEDEAEEFYADIVLNMELGTDEEFTEYKPREIYIVWPEEYATTELPKDDAVLLYTAEGKANFGSKLEIENKVSVEVYDLYILAKGFAGVEGYDLKVYYEDGEMTKVEPTYAYTGLETYDMCYFYPGNASSSMTLTEEGGTIKLYGYWDSSYDTYGTYTLNWGNGGVSSIEAVSADAANTAAFNLFGQKVGAEYKGIVIKNGKKMLK